MKEPLAIVGIACRFPGESDSSEAYWKNLVDKKNGIKTVPKDRWRSEVYTDKDNSKSGKICSDQGGFLNSIDKFDAEFFNFSPAQASHMDPQQRFLLETTYEAIEDSGIRLEEISGKKVAVYIGGFVYDYTQVLTSNEARDHISSHVAMGTSLCSLSNRISYFFNLKGPSITLDTACSSSLVAIHQACQSIWNNEAESAIAGGVNLIIRPESSLVLSKAGFLSPDGYSKAFDASANGYVRGEGVGIVIFKKLAKALEDKDKIYALVKGSGVNQDGFVPQGFTVPNKSSQMALINSVYKESGIDFSQVNYVEAHGTGTAVGDPIEVSSIGEVIGVNRSPDNPCHIGSVKSNIGHLEGAAGVAGFIKAILVLKNRQIPANLHINQLNPAIDFTGYNLKVPTDTISLEKNPVPLIASVNSFGAGGTNAHVILEEFPSQISPSNSVEIEQAIPFIISAKSEKALKASAESYIDFLNSSENSLQEIAYSLIAHKSQFLHQLAISANTRSELISHLETFLNKQTHPNIVYTQSQKFSSEKLAFVFSGQGGQWCGMGRDLMSNPIFKAKMQKIDGLFNELSGWSIIDELYKEKEQSRLNDTLVVQPATMAIQLALIDLWAHFGVKPQAVVGHSIGEVAAAYAASIFTLNEAVSLIYYRSTIQDKLSGKGKMLAVGLAEEQIKPFLQAYTQQVSIAAINSPKMTVLSGEEIALKEISETLERKNIFQRYVNTNVPYHSFLMEEIKENLLTALKDMKGKVGSIPFYSTVTAKEELGNTLNANYWYQNIRQPVLFDKTLRQMLADGYTQFIEIGPHPVLTTGMNEIIAENNEQSAASAIHSILRNKPEMQQFILNLSLHYLNGGKINLNNLFGDVPRCRLPKYPWQHQVHWYESPDAKIERHGKYVHPFLKNEIHLINTDHSIWETKIGIKHTPYLSDHIVDKTIIFPATGHIELAYAVAKQLYPNRNINLENFSFESALILPEAKNAFFNVRLELVSNEGDFNIYSKYEDHSHHNWIKHSSGRINFLDNKTNANNKNFKTIQEKFSANDQLNIENFYQKMRNSGIDYGKSFSCIQELWYKDNSVLSKVKLPNDISDGEFTYHSHPALLDAALHASYAGVFENGGNAVYLPHTIKEFILHKPKSALAWSYIETTQYTAEFFTSNAYIYDNQKELAIEIKGLVSRNRTFSEQMIETNLYENSYSSEWVEKPNNSISVDKNDIKECFCLIDRKDKKFTNLEATFIEAELAVTFQPYLNADLKLISNEIKKLQLDSRTNILFFPSQLDLSKENSDHQACMLNQAELLLEVIKTITAAEGTPQFYIYSINQNTKQEALEHSLLVGMSRVIRNEYPNILLKVITINNKKEDYVNLASIIFNELYKWDPNYLDSEILYIENTRYVKKIVSLIKEEVEEKLIKKVTQQGGHYQINFPQRGSFEKFEIRQKIVRKVKDNEVKIQVCATGINFKDIINIMGFLPEKAVAGGLARNKIGLEASGIITELGSQVKKFKVGDEVMVSGANFFSGVAIFPEIQCIKKPENLDIHTSAGLLVTYLTAYYSFKYLARLSAEDTVLIHSAAGGVGIAAINIAKLIGAKIIATAGSEEKRDYLKKNFNIDHVFDSRTLNFHEQIMGVTKNKGVDVVLNSLTGTAITQSLKCLTSFGRFIELGKADVYKNKPIFLERLGNNISYFVFDLDRLIAQKPHRFQKIARELSSLFLEKKLIPSEVKVFSLNEIDLALNTIARASHIGKIVVSMDNQLMDALPPIDYQFDHEKSYLITGGASGLGLEVAKWMSGKGAQHLILVSRSGIKTEQDWKIIQEMHFRKVNVYIKKCDISDRSAVDNLFKGLRASKIPPVAGIIHSAAVLNDALIPNMTREKLSDVIESKAIGALNLHYASLSSPIEFFIMLSSFSSVLGLKSQVNYAAANNFLDSLAEFRQEQGLPGSSINLGVLGKFSGMTKKDDNKINFVSLLEADGFYTMPLHEVLLHIEKVLIQSPQQRIAANLHWNLIKHSYVNLSRDIRFSELMQKSKLLSTSKHKNLAKTILEKDKKERSIYLRDILVELFSKIFLQTIDQVDVNIPIDTMGVDSLALTQVSSWILKNLAISYPIMRLLKGPSITSLASDLLEELKNPSNDQDTTSVSAEAIQEDWEKQFKEFTLLKDSWFIRGKCNADNPLRLICFHSMGVGASLFTGFLEKPPANVDVVAIQLPGRENRIGEGVMQDFNTLVNEIIKNIKPLLDKPFIVWGHSFGGLIAFEVLRSLSGDGLFPEHFIVSGTIAPDLVGVWQNRDVMRRYMIEKNSVDYLLSISKYIDNAPFVRSILSIMRLDAPLLLSYPKHPDFKIHCPITAISANQDNVVFRDEVQSWCKYTENKFDHMYVDGDHWFINRNMQIILDKLNSITKTFLSTKTHNPQTLFFSTPKILDEARDRANFSHEEMASVSEINKALQP